MSEPFPARLQMRALGAVACGLLSAFLAIFYLAARAGFESSVQSVAGVLGLAWCVIALPFAVHSFLELKGRSLRWYQREGCLTLLVILLTGLIGEAGIPVGRIAIPILFMLGLVAFAWTVRVGFRGMRARFAAIATLCVFGYAIWVAGVEWANGYLNPLFVETMILRGSEGHVDTLFFASLGNMLNTYGVASTGWDGVPYTAYHFGSSWLFAQWSDLVNLSVLDFYQVGAAVALVPLLLRSMFIFAAEVREQFFSKMTGPPERAFPVMGAVVVCGTIGFLPPSALNAAAVWSAGPFLSESYLLGLALALLVSSLIASFGTSWILPGVPLRGRSRWEITVFVLVFLPISVVAIGASKVSVMLLLLAAGLYLLLRLSLFRVPLFLAATFIIGMLSLYVYRVVVWPGANEGMYLLSFIRLAVAKTWWPFFFLLHLFWTWLYIYLRLKQESAETIDDVRSLVLSRKVIDVELALVFGLVGLLPGLFFNIQSAAYYFSDVQRWIAVSLFLANPSLLLRYWVDRRAPEPSRRGGGLRRLRLDRLIAVVLLVLVASTVLLTAAGWGVNLTRRNFAVRRALQDVAGTRPVNSLANEVVHLATHPAIWFKGGVQAIVDTQLKPLADNAAFARALQVQRRSSIVNALLSIGDLPVGQRRASLIYIDPKLQEYWQFLPQRGACQFSVMIGPALSGTALLDGVPPGCHFDGFYGTEAYHEKPLSGATVETPSTTLCGRARKLGFSRVIELQPAGLNEVRIVPIFCGA